MSSGSLRVLVVDDSAYSRQTIVSMLERQAGIQVVGRAGDGEEGLRLALREDPDVITLDLEMPRMDGYTFLRILMSQKPTPVVVVSNFADRDHVLKALELGAADFVAKPPSSPSLELRNIEKELVYKIRALRHTRRKNLTRATTIPPRVEPRQRPRNDVFRPPAALICIGASTGGPGALRQIFQQFTSELPAAILVSQHMPASFTAAFARRLDGAGYFEVREARTGDRLVPSLALVAPGNASMVVESMGASELRIRLESEEDTAARGHAVRIVPSIDRMMSSAALAMGSQVMGVVLTGMGSDGAAGVRTIAAAGGVAVAESDATAVIFGMPEEAIRTGVVESVLPLGQMAAAIERFAWRCARRDRGAGG